MNPLWPKPPYEGDEMHPLTEADWDDNWDAWKKADVIRRLNTKTWEIRPDLRVEARAIDRGVKFTLIEYDYTTPNGDPRRETWRSTQRNVSTMRELAQALLDACDYVEEKNPTWANKNSQEKIV